MAYNPATDFLGLWRSSGGTVLKEEVPGLDFLVAALGRSGLINVSVSGVAPVANQSTTAWFQPATPSYSGEGALQLWDVNAVAYAAATPRLFIEMLAAAEKAAGVTTAISSLLDSMGTQQGEVAFRGVAVWQALAPGTSGYILTAKGAAANPAWNSIGANGGPLDVLGAAQGDILYRDAGAWAALAPAGVAGGVLVSGGPAANPSWVAIGKSLTVSLGADVALNNTANYFDGPSINAGLVGTIFASGTVTVLDTAGATYDVKLWDGTTVIASTRTNVAANQVTPISLSGLISNPVNNIRISVKDGSAATGLIKFNSSGNAKDSTLTTVRVA